MIKKTLGAFFIWGMSCVGATSPAHANSTWTEQYASAMIAFKQGEYDAARAGFQRLADFGSPAAEAMLGHMYLNGLGVQKREGVAAVWYFRAAQKGYVNAQLIVGSMFASGKGFSQNLPRAFFWYEVARQRGEKQVAMLASEYQKRLDGKISAADKSKMLEAARNWRPNAATPR